jgi:hypothetical protein
VNVLDALSKACLQNHKTFALIFNISDFDQSFASSFEVALHARLPFKCCAWVSWIRHYSVTDYAEVLARNKLDYQNVRVLHADKHIILINVDIHIFYVVIAEFRPKHQSHAVDHLGHNLRNVENKENSVLSRRVKTLHLTVNRHFVYSCIRRFNIAEKPSLLQIIR